MRLMATTVPSESLARRIVDRLQAAGHTAYFAGGCVRDRLMGRTPADYDVATSARPGEVAALFPKSQQVGAAFGVVLVRSGRGAQAASVEVATFRTEGAYSDGRHPDAVVFATAEEDAQRRDFTCNGLFHDPIADRLLDFVGGQADIAAKTLRAIRDPARRFAEDHLPQCSAPCASPRNWASRSNRRRGRRSWSCRRGSRPSRGSAWAKRCG